MRRLSRPVAAYMLLLAMLVRGLVPAGWMPASSGGAPLAICTLHGLQIVDTAPKGQPSPQRDTAPAAHDICPFAAAAHLTLGPAAPAAPLPQVMAYAPAPSASLGGAIAREVSLVHGARAPPLAVAKFA